MLHDISFSIYKTEKGKLLVPNYINKVLLAPYGINFDTTPVKQNILMDVNHYIVTAPTGTSLISQITPAKVKGKTLEKYIEENRKKLEDEKQWYEECENTLLSNIDKQKPMTKTEEAYALSSDVNRYLKALNLPIIDEKYLTDNIYRFSTIGDALLKVEAFKHIDDHGTVAYLLTNEQMKSAMVRLGFSEFVRVNTHLAGSYFEAIYYVAHLTEDQKALDLLHQVIFGQVPNNIRVNDLSALTRTQGPFPVNVERLKSQIEGKDLDKILQRLGCTKAYLSRCLSGSTKQTQLDIHRLIDDMK